MKRALPSLRAAPKSLTHCPPTVHDCGGAWDPFSHAWVPGTAAGVGLTPTPCWRNAGALPTKQGKQRCGNHKTRADENTGSGSWPRPRGHGSRFRSPFPSHHSGNGRRRSFPNTPPARRPLDFAPNLSAPPEASGVCRTLGPLSELRHTWGPGTGEGRPWTATRNASRARRLARQRRPTLQTWRGEGAPDQKLCPPGGGQALPRSPAEAELRGRSLGRASITGSPLTLPTRKPRKRFLQTAREGKVTNTC